VEYLNEHEAEKTQVIDQPVWADGLMAAAYKHGFILKSLSTYDIWTKEDYQMMTFQLKRPYEKIPSEIDHYPLKKKMRQMLGIKNP